MINVTAATYMVRINSLNFADDTVQLAPTTDVLQKLSNVCQVYVAKHGIVYNTTKTESMVVSPVHSKEDFLQSAQLSERALTLVDRFTYLGHILHRDMTDDDDKEADHQFTVTGNILLRGFLTVAKG